MTHGTDALKDSLNAEKAGQWFDRLQSLQITRRLGLMAMIAVAVAAGLSVFFWSQKPGMVPLYTGLDQKATAEATDLLRAAQIPFALDPATGGITVPEKNLHDARLKLAGSGLTDSGKRLRADGTRPGLRRQPVRRKRALPARAGNRAVAHHQHAAPGA